MDFFRLTWRAERGHVPTSLASPKRICTCDEHNRVVSNLHAYTPLRARHESLRPSPPPPLPSSYSHRGFAHLAPFRLISLSHCDGRCQLSRSITTFHPSRKPDGLLHPCECWADGSLLILVAGLPFLRGGPSISFSDGYITTEAAGAAPTSRQ